MPSENPQAYGIDHATKMLQSQIETLTREVKALHEHLDQTLAQMRQEQRAGFRRLERWEKLMASQIEDMNVKLDNIANSETVLGQSIQQVVDALRANPTPQDLTAQLAKLDTIAQTLVDTNANTLANLPPTPAPPAGRR